MVGLLRVVMVVLESQAKLMAHPGIMLGEEEEEDRYPAQGGGGGGGGQRLPQHRW